MQSTSWETLGWMKHKLESRLDCYKCWSHTLITQSSTVTQWLWWRIEQFHSFINISSQSNHTSSSSWWSVSNSHSYSTRNNHCHKQPHSKSHKKKGERYGSLMNDCDCLWECCSIGDLWWFWESVKTYRKTKTRNSWRWKREMVWYW